MRNRISFGRAVRAVQAGRSVASFYSSLRNGVSMNTLRDHATRHFVAHRRTRRRYRHEASIENGKDAYFSPILFRATNGRNRRGFRPRIRVTENLKRCFRYRNRIGAIFFLFLLFFYDTKQPYRFTNTSNHRRKEQITTVNFFSFSLSKDLFQKIPLFLFLSFRFIKCTCYI